MENESEPYATLKTNIEKSHIELFISDVRCNIYTVKAAIQLPT